MAGCNCDVKVEEKPPWEDVERAITNQRPLHWSRVRELYQALLAARKRSIFFESRVVLTEEPPREEPHEPVEKIAGDHYRGKGW